MKAKNPGMHFEYVPKPKVIEPERRQYFLRAFWTFGYCVEAFKHCCDVLSIDVTFLTGKYEGTMLIAIGIDVNHQLVPLAFAIVEKENSGSWGWFLHLVWRVVVGPRCEICVISDRHTGILNAVHEVIPNYSRVHHRWCTRHLAQNIIKHDGIKDNFKLFEEVCRPTRKISKRN
jgi:transposase-like protein